MRTKSKLTLRSDDRNANLGTERGRLLLKESLEKLGAGRSIVCDRNGVVIGGNKTLEQAQALGMDVELVHSQGDKLIAVIRDDLDLEADPKARELAYFDNRVSELDLSWSSEQLLLDIDLLSATSLWTEQELALLQDGFDLSQFEAIAASGNDEPEEAPKAKREDKPESDLLPFHVLLTQQQRERLFEAIKEAKSKHGLETTAEALDVIVQDYL